MLVRPDRPELTGRMQAYHGLRAWRQLRQQFRDVGALEPPRRGRREPDEIDKISPVASPAATGLDAGDESGARGQE